MELRTNCQQLLERGQRELKTMVNLGSDFYVQAHVPDTGWIYVDVGLGFHAQMTLDEACAFATQREALNARAEELTARATRLKGGSSSRSTCSTAASAAAACRYPARRKITWHHF